ncbi:dolichyl-P-Man:Man(5)GlcNAc(2)-PP-dolichol alpha-1,3-mannosyltransferase [Sporobolomyces koalae]|uniref:dolichyl-P-Man:Man(5)GlcNAc(2)-PP-dolichol alpha-1,3-mannosyltransferase n=1 Tax=Sporobolomyces koalae TaxID=500713 RepID=UPI00316DF12F
MSEHGPPVDSYPSSRLKGTQGQPSSDRSAQASSAPDDTTPGSVTQLLQRVLTGSEWFTTVAVALLVWETVLCAGIIAKIPYTEIDFSTYLQQASAFLSGVRDYSKIKGDTGPCVYPAGHVYAYSLLYYLTDAGQHLVRAQILFAAIYIVTLAVVFAIYRRSERIPPYALIFLTLSKRVHSLYVLRMFNDCLAMLFLFSALWCYSSQRPNVQGTNKRWLIGTCLFSAALSIKMSVLLFLPALLYLVFVYHSPVALVQHVLLLCTTQTLLAAPFLTTQEYARTYWMQAFDFQRAFLWEWTVNWRWIGVEVFEDAAWGQALLMLHAAGLLVMAVRWSDEEGGVICLLKSAWKRPNVAPARTQLTQSRTITIFFTTNLIGILMARSLHYQFYIWFYHSIVWLLWDTWDGLGIEVLQKLVFLSLIEYGFNTYPSTVNGSLGLVLSLLILLVVGYYGRPVGDRGPPILPDSKKEI